MIKTLTALTAVAVIAGATVAAPSKAEANPAWLVPVIVAGGIGVVALGAAANANANAAYAPAGSVYVRPRAAGACHIVRERTAGGWRRVEVCN